MPVRGRFIVIDGPDGAGKTTQCRRVADALPDDGRALLVRDPGTTQVGEKLREVLLDIANRQEGKTKCWVWRTCIADISSVALRYAVRRCSNLSCPVELEHPAVT